MPINISEISGQPVNTEPAKKADAKDTGGTSAFAETLSASAAGRVNLDAIFEKAAETYGLPLNLLKAVAKAESSFRPDATSKSGAMGVMQLMPGTAKSLGVTDAYDPEQNIMGGAKYLSQQLDRFGDVSLALAAYNAGPGAVNKYDGIPPYKETQNYVKKIMSYIDGGEITAGSAVSPGKTTALSYTPPVIISEGASDNSALMKDNITQMLMLKVLEMQMKPSDDEDEHKII